MHLKISTQSGRLYANSGIYDFKTLTLSCLKVKKRNKITFHSANKSISFTHPYMVMIWPGVQKPHWAPSNLASLSCIG